MLKWGRPRPLLRPRGCPRLLPRVDEPRGNGSDVRRTLDAFAGSSGGAEVFIERLQTCWERLG